MIEYTKTITLCATNNGYQCFMDKEHPLSHSTGRVYLHRHLASIYLDRWLSSEEHVHHIDGNVFNNTKENLQILTAKEHAHIHKGTLLSIVCPVCNTTFKPTTTSNIYCSKKCSQLSQVKDKSITKEVLDELIPIHTWVALGKMFGYSDVAIKKRAISLGCVIPPRKRGPKPNNACIAQ